MSTLDILPYDVKRYELKQYLTPFDLNVLHHSLTGSPLSPVGQYGVMDIIEYDTNYIEFVIKHKLLTGKEMYFYDLLDQHDILKMVSCFIDADQTSTNRKNDQLKRVWSHKTCGDRPLESTQLSSTGYNVNLDELLIHYFQEISHGMDDKFLTTYLINPKINIDTTWMFLFGAISNETFTKSFFSNFVIKDFDRLWSVTHNNIKMLVQLMISSGSEELIKTYTTHKHLLSKYDNNFCTKIEDLSYNNLIEKENLVDPPSSARRKRYSNLRCSKWNTLENHDRDDGAYDDSIFGEYSTNLSLFLKYIDMTNPTTYISMQEPLTNSETIDFSDHGLYVRRTGNQDWFTKMTDRQFSETMNRWEETVRSDDLLEITEPELSGIYTNQLYNQPYEIDKETLLSLTYDTDNDDDDDN